LAEPRFPSTVQRDWIRKRRK